MRERFVARTIDGHAVTVPILLYAGVTLVDAKDKTSKALRTKKKKCYRCIDNLLSGCG